MTSLLNGFSGRIGEPEGQSRLMNPSRIEDAVNFVEANQESITNIIINGGGGSGNIDWARVNAAGTIIGSSGVSSVSRQGLGYYRVNLTTAATSSSVLSPVVTPSAASGNGGEGVITYQAYDSHEVEDVGDVGMSLYNPTNNKAYVFDSDTDMLFVHDLTNFTTDPVQVDLGSTLSGYGVVDREGRLVWAGEDSSSGKSLIAYDTTNGTIYDFGNIGPTLGAGWSLLAADYNSGSPRIWIYIVGVGLKRYSPNLGTEALGSADHAYSGFNPEYTQPATWDDTGTYWYASQSEFLYQVQAASTGIASYTYPSTWVANETVAGVGNQIMIWDSIRKKLYVPLSNNNGTAAAALLAFNPPIALVNNAGTWELLTYLQSTTPPLVSLDNDSNVLFIRDGIYAKRYIIDSMQLIDSVAVGNLTSPTAGSPAGANYHLWHYDHPDAYVYTSDSGDNKHVHISYRGSEITTDGGSVPLVGSALIAQYVVIDADTIDVYLFRSMEPMVRADGEFSIHIAKS